MKILALLLILASATQASAEVFNVCMKVGDNQSGVYFEHVLRRPTPNASEHLFTNLVFVSGTLRENLVLYGSGAYQGSFIAICKETQLNLTQEAYTKMDCKYLGAPNGNIELKFDTQSDARPNGHVKRTLADGSVIEFDLNCAK